MKLMAGAKKTQPKIDKAKVRVVKTQKGKWLTWVIAAIVLLFLVNTWWLIFGSKAQNINGMKEYLLQRYEQDFTLQNYRSEGSGLGEVGVPTADAYPTNNSSMIFRVWKNSSNHPYGDNYLSKIWSEQAKDGAGAFVKETLPGVDTYSVNVISGSVYKNTSGNVANFDEIRQQAPSDIEYSISVKNTMNKASSDEPNREQLERALKLVYFVKALNIPNSEVHYLYRGFAGNGYQYSIDVTKNQINTISSADDLRNYFKQLD